MVGTFRSKMEDMIAADPPFANTVETAQPAIVIGGARKPKADEYTAEAKLDECNFNARLRGDFRSVSEER
jgi:hypothetical protein